MVTEFAPIGFSDVPLTKSVLAERREFIKTWAEWQADHAELIVIDRASTSGGAATIFTVPVNNTLYITGAYVGGKVELVVAGSVGIHIRVVSLPRVIINAQFAGNSLDNSGNNALSYPMPIKVEAEQVVIISSSTQVSGEGGFIGFLVKKDTGATPQ